jgi:hypothetical protein
VAKGVKFGPKFKLNHFQRQEALAQLEAGESPQRPPPGSVLYLAPNA